MTRMASSLEVKIGKLIGAVKALNDDNRAAIESRRSMHEELKTISLDLHTLRSEIKGLTDRMDAIEPGVKDYLRVQQQVAGAGKLGRGLWIIGAALLAVASWAVGHLTSLPGR